MSDLGTTQYHTVMGFTAFGLFGPDTSTPEGAASVAPVTCNASGLRVMLPTGVAMNLDFTLLSGATIATLTTPILSCTILAASAACTSAGSGPISAGNLVVLRSQASGPTGPDVNVFFGWTCQ